MENFFARNLKYMRESKKLSQNKLGEMAGVNQTTIARWETEEMSPTIDNLVDVSNALNIGLPELVGIDLTVENNIYAYEKNPLNEFEGVKICFNDGTNVDDLSEEDKALLSATIKSIKKNIDKQLDGEE